MRGRRLLAAAGVLLGMLWFAAPAGAHAVLVGSSPTSDAVLDAAPDEVRLDFDESVTISDDAVRVFDPAGDEVGGVAASLDWDRTVVAELPDLAQQGSYTVGWRAVSGDGHPIRGAFLFHLGGRTLTEPVEIPDAGAPLAAELLRGGGAVAALGGLVVVLGVGRRVSWRWLPVVGGTAAAVAGSLLAVGGGLGDAFGVVVDTMSGRMALVALGAAVLGSIAALTGPRPAELAVAAASVVAVAAQGHAVSLDPLVLSATLTVAHVAAAVAWGVGLVLVERAVRTTDAQDARSFIRRASPWGVVAVLVLGASGAVLVLDRVPTDELVSSTYGRLALVKLVLLLVAVVLALRNRLGDAGPTALLRSVRVEAVVLAVALVVGAALSQVPPPGELTGGDVVERREIPGGFIELTVEPGERGTNEVHVLAISQDGRLLGDVGELTLELSLPERDLGPLEPEMQPIAAGHSVAYADVPLAGEWEFTVVARPSRFEEITADFTVPVGG